MDALRSLRRHGGIICPDRKRAADSCGYQGRNGAAATLRKAILIESVQYA
jgi:hypothetical protein